MSEQDNPQTPAAEEEAAEEPQAEATIAETAARLMDLISERASKQLADYLPSDQDKLDQSTRATAGNIRGAAGSFSQLATLAGEWAVDTAAQWTIDRAKQTVKSNPATVGKTTSRAGVPAAVVETTSGAVMSASIAETTPSAVVRADELVVSADGKGTDLCVYNLGPVEASVTLCTTPLTSFDGAEIRRDYVTFSPVSLSVPAMGSGAAQVSVRVPEGIPPGEYYGQVQVTHKNDPKTASRISIRVIVPEQPSEPARPTTADSESH